MDPPPTTPDASRIIPAIPGASVTGDGHSVTTRQLVEQKSKKKKSNKKDTEDAVEKEKAKDPKG